MDVLWKDSDGALWDPWWNGTEWEDMKLSDGPLNSIPAPLYGFAEGRMDVFWQATDGSLWDTWWNGAEWADSKI